MTEDKTQKSRKKRSSSGNSKKGSQRNFSDNEIPGLIPAMYGLAEILPDEYQEPAKKVIGIFGFVVIAMFVIFFIGVLIATFTGHPDQMYTIFPTYIYGIGAIAVAAIFLISKKTIK
jgi:formate hydrogenlyase subunit 3/multisubunit Na+/H+ antiporter MnhD subunit